MSAMSRRWGLLAVGALWLAAGWAGAAYLRGGGPEAEDAVAPAEPPVRPGPPLPRSPLPRPGGEWRAVAEWLRSVRVGEPVVARGLTVYPLLQAGPVPRTDCLVLDEALRNGSLEVVDSGSIGWLRVRNRGRRAAFLMSGQCLVGGWQNRMLRQDVLIPPGPGEWRVPVYCVEHGRWQGGDAFGGAPGTPSWGLREKAVRGASQDEVWNEVRAAAGALRSGTADGDWLAAAAAPAVAGEVQAARREFLRSWPGQTVGLAVVGHGRVCGLDLCGDPALFERLRDVLLDSYVLEHLRQAPGGGWPGGPGPGDVAALLARIRAADGWATPTPGAGTGLEFAGRGVRGRALVDGPGLLHLEAGGEFVPVPPPPYRPLEMDRPTPGS